MRRLKELCVVSALACGLLVASCAPSVAVPETVPVGSFNIASGHPGRWEVGVPVNLRLWAAGTGSTPNFQVGPVTSAEGVTSGGLPLGVALVGNSLIGTPEQAGIWFVKVTVEGSLGTRTAELSGYVAGRSQLNNYYEPIAANPARSAFVVTGARAPDPDLPSDAYVQYDPGALLPTGVAEFAYSPAWEQSETTPYSQPEFFSIGFLRSERSLIQADAADCVTVMSDLFRWSAPPIGSFATPRASDGSCPNASVSEDGSTVFSTAVFRNTDQVLARYIDFRDSLDASLIRTVNVPAAASSSPVLSDDGDAAAYLVPGAVAGQGSELVVVGADASQDRFFALDGNIGRTCGVVEGFRARKIALKCQTPGLGSQVGYVDAETGRVWLSPVISSLSFASPASIAPTGEQIIFVTLGPWSGNFGERPNMYIWLVDTDGPGTPMFVMDAPASFNGLLAFLPA
jgi:hypothetical protein